MWGGFSQASSGPPCLRLLPSLSETTQMSARFRAKKKPLFGPVDDEVYNWLEVVYNLYISRWYPRVSPDGHLDQDLVDLLVKASSQLKERSKSLTKMDFMKELCTIVDLHMKDVDYVLERSRASSEQIQTYLAMNSHPGFVEGKLDRTYLNHLASHNISGLFPNVPASIHALLTGVLELILWKTVDILSEPWFLHHLIISLRNRKVEPEPEPKHQPKKRRFANDTSSYFSSLVVHRSNLLVDILYSAMWPFHNAVNSRLNAFIADKLDKIDQVRVSKWLYKLRNKIFPGGHLLHSEPPPSLPEQMELEIEAQEAAKFYGIPLLPMKMLQHKVINQRLLIYFLDYQTNVFWPLDDVRSTWCVFLRPPSQPTSS